jgi:hypothetical protein
MKKYNASLKGRRAQTMVLENKSFYISSIQSKESPFTKIARMFKYFPKKYLTLDSSIGNSIQHGIDMN